MSYSHLLVAVAPTPESRVLINKAVSIARPLDAKVSLITLATDPELYNQFAAPMLENLRDLMHEETRDFLRTGERSQLPYRQRDDCQRRTQPPHQRFLPAASRGPGDMWQSQPQPVFARHLLGEKHRRQQRRGRFTGLSGKRLTPKASACIPLTALRQFGES